MPVYAKGAIPAYYDLSIHIPDTPRSIAEITGLLAQEEISITNILYYQNPRRNLWGVVISVPN